jgi:exopolysaccharide biosynthesis polyprenyl glycosylphosphotransferase
MASSLDLGSGSERDPALLPPRQARHESDQQQSAVLFTRATPASMSVQRPRWEGRYARVVAASDLVAVLIVVVIGHVLGLGNYQPSLGGTISPELGLVITALTALALVVTRAWDQRVLGQGSEEFTRLIRGFTTAAVVLGLAGLALQLPALRPWVFGLLPLAGLLSLLGRFLLRKWLHRKRAAGRFVHPMLAVGTVESVEDIIRRTRRDPATGWIVRAACTPTGSGHGDSSAILGVPVVGDLDSVAETVREGCYRAVSIGQAPGWTGRRLHQLAWDVEGLGTDLVVDPGLMEMAGPRLHIAPVDGLPLLRLTQPAFDGLSRVMKTAFDRLGAALLLLATAPLLVLIAVAVKLDGGPVFFRQIRVGRHGKTFRMIKFRSMCVDAEARKAELLAANEGSGPLFKLRHDPRVTRIGAALRKYSLDELPQLFNVLAGSMSLVGPRPPLPEEVAQYTRDAERRLLVRPGVTGLWQVSGRSNLSWEETVRLDLRYVENWTPAMDALILWKTFGAMMRGSGAY